MATNLAAANNNGQIMIGMGKGNRSRKRERESREGEGRRQAARGWAAIENGSGNKRTDLTPARKTERQTDGGNWTLSVVASALRLETSFVILARAFP